MIISSKSFIFINKNLILWMKNALPYAKELIKFRNTSYFFTYKQSNLLEKVKIYCAAKQ